MRDLIDREAALACFHDWMDRNGDVHTADEMPEYQRIEALPSVDLNDCAGCRYEYFGSATCGICSRAYMDRYKEVQHE